MWRYLGAFVAAILAITLSAVEGQPNPGPAPTVRPAIDGILQAFESHPLVGLGDYHGLAQEADIYAAILRDPRFARDVGNVVVEFGTAIHQPIIDRYVAGEALPYTELRKVWSDVIGFVPTVVSMGMINVYATVREANLKLPPGQRIRIWLGAPPVDWSLVRVRQDLDGIGPSGDAHAAALIEREILARNKKALVIYGGGHFVGPQTLGGLIEAKRPGAFFRVTPYTGFFQKTCSVDFEKNVEAWPVPALAFPIRSTTLETRLRKEGCTFLDHASYKFPPTLSKEQIARIMADMEATMSGIGGEALLYLGPAAALTLAPENPDIYLDIEYRAEIERRNVLMGRPPFSIDTLSNPVVPRRLKP